MRFHGAYGTPDPWRNAASRMVTTVGMRPVGIEPRAGLRLWCGQSDAGRHPNLATASRSGRDAPWNLPAVTSIHRALGSNARRGTGEPAELSKSQVAPRGQSSLALTLDTAISWPSG
jgi:hypothetical protein